MVSYFFVCFQYQMSFYCVLGVHLFIRVIIYPDRIDCSWEIELCFLLI